MKILAFIQTVDKDLQIVRPVCYDPTRRSLSNRRNDQVVPINRSTRQGCVMSPDLFILYPKVILRDPEDRPGVAIQGVKINNLCYADDAILMAKFEQDFQNLFDVVVTASEHLDPLINK